MKVNELKQIGGLVPSDLVPVDTKWVDPEGNEHEFTVFVRRISYVTMERALAVGEAGSYVAATIAECIRLGDAGEEQLSYEQAASLHPTLAKVLASAVELVQKKKVS